MLELERLGLDFTVSKVLDYTAVDPESEFCFTGSTDAEKSLVCPTRDVPKNTIAREDGWKAFRVRGTLAFSCIGILSEIASVLAGEQIGIFVVSTYNTDYVFVKAESYAKAAKALTAAGCTVI